MKLKTLKDLEYGWNEGYLDRGKFAKFEDLKAEAVKWVKEEQIRLEEDEDRKPYDLGFESGVEWFIRKFFNLTEEDLK